MNEGIGIAVFLYAQILPARWAIAHNSNLHRWSVGVFLLTAVCWGGYFTLTERFSALESAIRAVGVGLTGASGFRVFCFLLRLGRV